MLVLSRKVGEKMVIPGLAAEIAVVAIRGKVVRLGISAPASVAVRRAQRDGNATAATNDRGSRIFPQGRSAD